jgi:hypothetical protein
MTRATLSPDFVCDVWEQLLAKRGDVSLQDVADQLAVLKHFSPRTGRPYSRQNLHLVLQKTARGKAILAKRRKMSHSGPGDG